ncbi:MAG: VWA domain-containing protein [bacterium]|nr:VWA domain-containing protein [bacterium]
MPKYKFFAAPLFTVLFAVFLLLPQKAMSADKHPPAVLIIDGSGSMWGRLNKREKIVIARQELARQIDLLRTKVDLGVMSYGHRRRRDCRDIEMIVPISPIDQKVHSEAIKRLLPRGKTPISSALEMAAKALKSSRTQHTKGQLTHIVLVADGIENCRRNPCKTAADLSARYPGLAIDVIGFAVPEAELPQLECIAQNNKGRFHRANNTTELQTAIKQVFSSLGATSKPAIIVKKKQIKKEPSGLYLSAGLSSKGAVLDQDISWRIYPAGQSSKTGATPLQRHTTAAPFLPLPSGQYHIEVRHQTLLAERDVTLRADTAIKLHLSFNIGIFTASAKLGESAAPSDNIIFSVYDASSGSDSTGEIIAHKQQSKAVFYLPPGTYSLKARANETQTRHDFTLKAGERKTHISLLDAGEISFNARLAKDLPELRDVQYAIYQRRSKKDVEFIRTLDPNPRLILPKGDYFVLARQGAASSYTRLFVKAGDTKTISLTLNAGILKLSSNLDNRAIDQSAQIAYTIEPVDHNNSKTVKLSADSTLVEIAQSLPTRSFRNRFVLRAGDYVIKAIYGNSNARASAQVHVVAGEETEHEIKMSAGRVKFSLALALGDPPLPGVFWSILDASNNQIASASSITPRLTLAKGNYQVVADYLGESYRKSFVINNGDNKNIQLELQ